MTNLNSSLHSFWKVVRLGWNPFQQGTSENYYQPIRIGRWDTIFCHFCIMLYNLRVYISMHVYVHIYVSVLHVHIYDDAYNLVCVCYILVPNGKWKLISYAMVFLYLNIFLFCMTKFENFCSHIFIYICDVDTFTFSFIFFVYYFLEDKKNYSRK